MLIIDTNVQTSPYTLCGLYANMFEYLTRDENGTYITIPRRLYYVRT